MSNNLQVDITVNLGDLQTKYAIARAETAALASEMNKLAKASVAGTIDAAGSARLTELARDLVAVRSQANGLAAEMAKTGYSVNGFSTSLEHTHGSISTATREFRALFDEISSGRTRQSPGTIAILLQRVLGLGPAALASVGGVAALTAGIGYLAYRSIETSKALDQIRLGADFVGNLDLSRAALSQFVDELSKTNNVSSSAAQKIVAEFAKIPGITVPGMQALTASVAEFAQQSGQDAQKAGEQIAKMFEPKETADAMARSLSGLTQAQINDAEAADRSGNAHQVLAAKIQLLNAALAAGGPDLIAHNASMASSVTTMIAYLGALTRGTSYETIHAAFIKQQNADLQKQISLRQQSAAQLSAAPAGPEQTLRTGVAVAEKENPIAMQIDEAKTKVSELTAALAVAQQRGDAIDISKLNAGLLKANEELSQLQFGPVMERMRDEMASVAATWDGTQSGMLTKQRQVAQAALAQEQAGSKDYLAIQAEIARLSVQIRQDAGQEIIAGAREQVSQIDSVTQASAVQRFTQEAAVWQKLLAGATLTASQQVEVQRALNTALASLDRERVAQNKKDAESQLTAQRETALAQITLQKQVLESSQGGSGKDVTAAATAAEIQLTVQELEAWEQYYSAKAQLAGADLALQNQIQAERLAKERELDGSILTLQKSTAKEAGQQWQTFANTMSNALDHAVNGMLTRTETFKESMLKMSVQLTQGVVSNLVKVGTEQAVQSATGIALQRTAQQQAVMMDAKKAASGAYASVSSIPYVGWILAPIAAAAAFAAVEGFSAEGGWDVPAGMNPVTQLHQREMVLPSRYADVIRGVADGGGDGGGGGGTTVHMHNQFSGLDGASMIRMATSPQFHEAMAHAARTHFGRGGR